MNKNTKQAIQSKDRSEIELSTKKSFSKALLRKSYSFATDAKQKWTESRENTKRSRLLLTQEAGFLEAEGMEKTYKFTQEEIKPHLDLVNQSKIFELNLEDFGPYSIDYSRNGRSLLLGGHKGHIAAFDWKTGRLACEVHLRESVHDVKWLHNETMFAVAQKENVFIYDNMGIEIHSLRRHCGAKRLTFLPYHYLLASIGDGGVLRYQDISTGELAAENKTHLGTTRVLAQNPWNAMLHCGHANGTVSVWSPNMTQAAVKMLCHRGPVSAIAIDRIGRHMVTAGIDGQVKVWDVRTFQPLNAYYSPRPTETLAISQKGLVAIGWGRSVALWRGILGDDKQKSPYMTHELGGGSSKSSRVSNVLFAPYEDVLGIGHSNGFSSIVVPGAGEANYDALEDNPYETRQQRREQEVRSLIEKLQPDTITLDPSVIGGLAPRFKGVRDTVETQRNIKLQTSDEVEKDTSEEKSKINLKQQRKKDKKDLKMDGIRKYLRKQRNVIDSRKEALRAKLEGFRDQKNSGKKPVRNKKSFIQRVLLLSDNQ